MNRPGDVTVGTIFVQEGLLLPRELNVTSEIYSPGWRTVSGTVGFPLEQTLRTSGWGFFFLAGELKGAAFGLSRPRMLRAAVRKLLAQVRSEDFNCAEFTNITKSHFLGIPYISVRGHARHIQHGCQMDTAEKRKQQQAQADWAIQ